MSCGCERLAVVASSSAYDFAQIALKASKLRVILRGNRDGESAALALELNGQQQDVAFQRGRIVHEQVAHMARRR